MSATWLSIIGIGEDGMAGLSAAARQIVEEAEVIVGGDRHHHLSPNVTAERLSWPHPFDALIEDLTSRRGKRLLVLATGDPLWFSVGARIARAIPPEEISFFPQLSAFQWAAARMGWSMADVETLTVHGRPVEQIIPRFWPNVKLLILTSGADTPGKIAGLLADRGYGASRLTVLGNLGGPDENCTQGTAAAWAEQDPGATLPAFNTLAVDCIGTPEKLLSAIPGLPDDAFVHDGKITKQEVRSLTLAKLMPARGEVLWDLGIGCGSIAIEWMRAAPDALAVGIDRSADRLDMARQNAQVLGVPKLHFMQGALPGALDDIPAPEAARTDLRRPNAVFLGGGISADLIDRAVNALAANGRCVANAVTLESESILIDAHGRHGGTLTRISVQRAEPVGHLTGWRPAMPVMQWALLK